MSKLTKTIVDAATGPFFRKAEVVDVIDVADNFRRIDLAGPALIGVKWSPGQKVQIRVGDGLTLRTYTPLHWNSDSGSTSIIAFTHGTGPGSATMAAMTVGAPVQLFGPRSSLPLDQVAGAALFVGDETSIGVAVNRLGQDRPTRWLFEAVDPDGYQGLLGRLGIDATVVASPNGGPDHPLRDAVVAALGEAGDGDLVLTGRAQSIATIRAAIKSGGLGGQATKVKAYWDEKRSGLD
jgi:NADPH-dependent ferric siderophore reductase